MADNNNRSTLLTRIVILGLLLTVVLGFFMFGMPAMTERNAMDFVRLNGYTSQGYAHNSLSVSIERALPPSNEIPYLVDPLVGVAFPRNRMTEKMAKHLLNIRNLDSIELYPADLDGSGFDGAATTIKAVSSLGDLDLPLSIASIQRLEERFPNLRVYTAEVPRSDPDSQLRGAATK